MLPDWKEYVRYDKRYERPAEVDLLIGNPARAKKQLGWKPKTPFEELVPNHGKCRPGSVKEQVYGMKRGGKMGRELQHGKRIEANHKKWMFMDRYKMVDAPEKFALRYFSVETTDSGLVDKLAYQLRILYHVGMACGYEYVHSPLSFRRSWRSKASGLQRARNQLERLMFFKWGSRIPAYRLIDKAWNITSRVERLLGALFKEERAFSRFLGLDRFDQYITDKKFQNYTVIDVPYDRILENNAFTNIHQLRGAIEEFIAPSNPVVYRFSAGRMYPYIARLKGLLEASGVDTEDYNFLDLSGRYWAARNKWPVSLVPDNGKINVVIHIRRGDSTVIDLGKRRIYLHGGLVTREAFERLLDVDPGRQVDTREYKLLLDKMFDEFGADNFSCTLISDGYEQTLNLVIKAIYRGHLRLDDQELTNLRRYIMSPDEELLELAGHTNAYAIIGESNSNLCKSIHALACADIVLYGSLGFSFGVHKLFSKGQDSIMVGVKDDYNQHRRRIGMMMAARANKRRARVSESV